jgi:threonylcarbamoyladenosine tRNA methylthiotransferase MtaB
LRGFWGHAYNSTMDPLTITRCPGDNRGTVAIVTHGCKLNKSDSDELARQFVAAGYRIVEPEEGPDVFVLNTCTVTHEADAKARQALRNTSRSNPKVVVVATGCYAQRAPQELASMPGVGLVVTNSQKPSLVQSVLAARGQTETPCATGEEPMLGPGSAGRTRAFIKIQEGCNQVCAYCIVPRVRGRERSVPVEELVRQVERRVSEGYKEVVLTGTQLGSYGFDLQGATLESMVRRVLEVRRIGRLRVSSLQPQEITQGLLALWRDSRLCPHFHLPLQSGSVEVLRRMRRRYTPAQYAEAVERIKQAVLHASVTADVIVGFPGESDAEFEESLIFCQEMPFAGLHVFEYSVRGGTSAAYMGPKVAPPVKAQRMAKMLALARDKASSFRQKAVGEARPVLWEMHRKKGRYVGLTDHYLKVSTGSKLSLANTITMTRIVAVDGESLIGEVVE